MPFISPARIVIRIVLSIAAGLAPLVTAWNMSAASEMQEVRQFDPRSGTWVKRRVDNSKLAGKLNAAPVPPQLIAFEGGAGPGTIIVDTERRRLLYVNGDGTATEYIIGVGREGFAWKGSEKISRKAEWPSWTPPEEMRRREAHRGRILPITMEGGPDNPLGARALYLGGTLYRIHGTNEPWTLGKAVSSGCIRMANDDVIDLYNKVRVGSPVVVK
ncbi:L,D-transpeptidase [Pseudaminobacter arsenicus]|uniref:L,D-transpeptidase n=1 Tax=Borborobacter arsenicus TaxID=1851146 RepID=A0A432V0J2_9HYPH|nr:L,D-transpeptidase [Pseudaminobacter arsenicus]RUM95605.1 L,D-transpeptidase [Pseudaminobacter arsenicus]